jgi:glucose/arabinose dehydrogenase
MVALEEGAAVDYDVFADGWLRKDEVSGRPVDLLVMPDGSMLVSDDLGGKLFRISYEGD